MTTTARAIRGLAIFWLSAARLHAQSSAAVQLPPVDSGAILRLTTVGGSVFQGRVIRQATGSLTMRSDGAAQHDTTYQAVDIRLIETGRQHRNARKGLLIGGLGTATAASVLAAWAIHDCNARRASDVCGQAIFVVVPAAGLGALIGGIAGGMHVSTSWTPMWQR